jgi:metal-responsive CopG/Arc/MetJ family transcriptional regulator
MAENVTTTLELKEKQLEYLDEMAKKYDMADRSKALRCLITFAMQEAGHEASIFTEIRCVNC